ncbi:MAG: von Willebrand factor type A domain-containing protein [Anaerolineales bacterium]|jgi:Ca-activated chloride channel family protein
MKSKKFITLLILLGLALASCQSAAPEPEEPIANVPAERTESPPMVEEEGEAVVVTEVVEVVVTPPPIAIQPLPEEPRPVPTASHRLPVPGTVPTPADNYFQDYGVNPFVDAFEDHLSTFALDVDTASYSVARRYVMEGNLPPADAVRVEEFVNYFDQGYATPDNVAFAIYADGAPSPFRHEDTYILRFGVKGYEVPEWGRKPASLTFVIDVSGSMDRENRLGLVKQSLQLLVDRLRPDDTVAIVVYGSRAYLVLPPTPGDQRETILNAIYSLRPEGSTNAEAGLRLGYEMAMQTFKSGATNRVILCSDGVANVGATGPDEILGRIRGYVEEGVTLTTVGFGMGNFNDVLMEQLADNGDGHYAYVDTLDEARKLFIEDLTATLQVIAKDAKVQVDFNPEVVAYYRLMGYENRDVADQDFRNDAIDAGEIGAGHSATALYEVVLRPDAGGRIATVQLRWEDPETYQVHEINGNFNTWDLAQSFDAASPYYRLAVIVGHYAEILRRSPWMQDISLSQVHGLAFPLAHELPWDQEVSEFLNLISRASQIESITWQ